MICFTYCFCTYEMVCVTYCFCTYRTGLQSIATEFLLEEGILFYSKVLPSIVRDFVL